MVCVYKNVLLSRTSRRLFFVFLLLMNVLPAILEQDEDIPHNE